MPPYSDIILVIIGSGNQLLPDGTKPVPEQMLTSNQFWDQFHCDYTVKTFLMFKRGVEYPCIQSEIIEDYTWHQNHSDKPQDTSVFCPYSAQSVKCPEVAIYFYGNNMWWAFYLFFGINILHPDIIIITSVPTMGKWQVLHPIFVPPCICLFFIVFLWQNLRWQFFCLYVWRFESRIFPFSFRLGPADL